MASGVQALLQKYGTPMLVALALTLGTAFVKTQINLGVARALTRAYVDSVHTVMHADSVAGAYRDSVAHAKVVALQASHTRDAKTADSALTLARGLSQALAIATTAQDTIDDQAHLIAVQSVVITGQAREIDALDSIVAVQAQTERDLRGRLAFANLATDAALARLNKQAGSSFFTSTPFKVGEAVLATLGAVKVGQTLHLF